MKILFLNSPPIFIHGLPNGFQDLGHEIFILNALTEASFAEMLSSFYPDLIVIMGWSAEHTLTQFKRIRRIIKPLKIPLVYWSTEDPAHTAACALPFIQNVRPDFVFTICMRKIDYFKSLGIKAAYLDFGYHDKVHYRIPPCDTYKAQITVVANAYSSYLTAHPDYTRNKSLQILINPLLEHHIRIDFWGKDWETMNALLSYPIPKEWIHGYLDYTETYKVYSSADIVIGLQNKQVSMRTYEILGSEAFLLTHNSPAVSSLFKNNHDLVLSSSPEETLSLVNYYLSHPEEREKIRQQGHRSVQCYHYKYKADYMIKVLKKENILPINLS